LTSVRVNVKQKLCDFKLLVALCSQQLNLWKVVRLCALLVMVQGSSVFVCGFWPPSILEMATACWYDCNSKKMWQMHRFGGHTVRLRTLSTSQLQGPGCSGFISCTHNLVLSGYRSASMDRTYTKTLPTSSCHTRYFPAVSNVEASLLPSKV
jgi:hypothetical protein